MNYQNDVYLDTHVLVWLSQTSTHHLSKTVIEFLEDGHNRLLISPMVVLELEFLHEIGRINHSADEILAMISDVLELTICQKSWINVVKMATTLKFTRDPFDRLITAHAKLDNNLLITKDTKITTHYAHCIW
ncbi:MULTISPECIES: type II toxin-antitoxin system VapC family toxin [unclassified Acinetobacter]|uniref:type II toxin-antitoxin system VapC family toxin n=1 Tax=unclassified Acinetobacter TaxID=196816 RepID=UPI0035B9C988